MEVKNLFDNATYQQMVDRLNRLTPESKGHWGKMNVSQMLTHCKRAFRVPLSDKPLPRMFLGRLLGWLARPKLYNNIPWGKSLPTAPSFIVKDERVFEKEKAALLELVEQFHTKGPDKVGVYPHPFFGRLTKEQWGKSMWKHLDHHLRQFGV
ncbi:MAG TPA: DUF1569 domain-containing protein [Chitinophagaceae bacterium]